MDIRESQNYLRLHILVNGEGSNILRQVFKRRFHVLTKTEWEDGSRFAKEFLRTYGNSNTVLPIQRGMLETTELNKFDIPLLSSLIHHVDSVSPGGLEGRDNTRLENASVQEIVDGRNKIAHLPGKSVDMRLFEELWGKIKPALINLGVEEETIEEIRSGSEFEGISFESGKTAEEEAEELKNAIEAGDLSMQNCNYLKAIRNYSVALSRKCLSVEEKISVLSKRSDAFIQYLLDTNLPSKDEVEENCKLALEDAEEMIKTDPDLWKGYFLAGQVHKYRRDWKLAIDCFDQALALNPGLPEVVKPRDECRYEWSKGERKEHMNPQTNPVGLKQYIEKFSEQRGFGPKPETVLKEYEGMLASKDPKKRAAACAFYGNLYEQGVDVEQNYSKAAKYYEEAADAGDILALCSLGTLYMEGKGVPRNIEKGIELIEKAAKSKPEKNLESMGDFKIGVAQAQHCLGKCFEDGVGKPQDYAKAAQWYSQGCDNGSGPAAHNLGLLYLDGRGIPRSPERGKQYLRLAAGRGVELSMDTLAWIYLNEYKADVAEDWYKQSVERGNLHSILNQDAFYKALAEVRHAVEECQKTTSNPTVEDIRAKLISLQISPNSDPDLLEICSASSDREQASVVNMFHGMDFENTITGKIWTKREEIRKRALAGHRFAQDIIRSMNYFSKGIRFLQRCKRSNSEDRVLLQQGVVENIANCLRLQEIVVFSESSMNEALRSICSALMSKGKEKSEDDKNARVCHCWVLMQSRGEELFPFLEISRRKYPRETTFYKFHAGILACLQKIREALRITNQALDLFPNHAEFLFQKASSMKILISSKDEYKYEDIIAAYEKFIATAPFDDRMIPEAYYSMAYLTVSYGKHIPNYFGVMEDYYKQGLETEEKILPCFLPYKASQAKPICEAKIKQKSQVQSKVNKLAGTAAVAAKGISPSLGNDRSLQPTNPTRVEAVVRFRKMFKSLDAIASANYKTNISVQPKSKQNIPRSLANLEEITFSEMITTKDQVYNGRLLNLTVTEDPMVGMLSAIHLIAKDKNDDNLNISFYKLDHQTAKIDLSFGSQISIINPYFRIAADGTLAIRVDDPRSIIYHTDGKKSICRYCWKENPKYSCATCGRAKYCSKECQSQDWKVLKHKYICKLSCFDDGIAGGV